MAATAETATDFQGGKLYQQRARVALPILVRQAKAGTPVVYQDLAAEMQMPNPRNLNYPLGCIGDALIEVGARWGKDIPHIQALVVNKSSRMPGPGFDGFLTQQGNHWSTPRERRAIIETYWSKITSFPYWDRVLDELKLKPAPVAIAPLLAQASGSGGGEGPEHRAMKELVRKRPSLVGFEEAGATVSIEHYLPSGDSIDVFFSTVRTSYAVEVKPAGAPDHDIARGLFQCVKYRAVLEARAAFESDDRKVAAVLALGGKFPKSLIPLRNSLGVQVFDRLMA